MHVQFVETGLFPLKLGLFHFFSPKSVMMINFYFVVHFLWNFAHGEQLCTDEDLWKAVCLREFPFGKLGSDFNDDVSKLPGSFGTWKKFYLTSSKVLFGIVISCTGFDAATKVQKNNSHFFDESNKLKFIWHFSFF